MAKLIGNQPNQVPTNGDLGTMAYQDSDNVVVGNLSADGAVVINESGADVDFRIESDTNTHAFFLEGSSGNVGIGTSSPASLLTVKKGTEADQANQPSGTFAATVYHASNASGANGLLVKNNWAASTSTVFEAGLDLIGTGYRSYFKVAGDGNVGIGTSSPSAQLHVQNSSGNSTSILGQYGTGTRAEVTAASNEVVFKAYNGTNDVMAFYTGASERMRIDSSGNVGIGTSSPAATLSVHQSDAGLAQEIQGTSGVYTRLGTSTTSLYTVHSTTDTYIYTQESAALRFGTAATERMRIDSSGNVGIGTSSPDYLLDIANGTSYSASGDFLAAIQQNSNTIGKNGLSVMNAWAASTSKIFEAAMGWNGVSEGYYPVFTIDGLGQTIWQNESGSERMRIDSSGNVGVGTSSPSTKLHLEGTDSSPTALRLTNTTASTGKSWQITSTNAGLLQLATIPGVADYLTVNSSGNVGVGTSSPSARLQVANATSSGTVIFQHPGNASFGTILTLETTGGTDDPVLSFKNYNGGSPVYYGISGTDNGSLAFKSGASTGGFGAERMRIDSSGNLRINSTTGSGRVYIYENNAAFYSINFDSSNNTGTQYYLEFKRQGVQAGYLTSNSSTTVQLNNTSDVRLKENIEDAGSALASVMAAQVRQFDWKENRSPHQDFGFVAQELVNIIPEAVTVGTDNEDGTIKMPWGIDYSHIVPRLVKSIQEQQELIQSLTDRIAALEA